MITHTDEIRPGVLPAHPDTTIIKWLGTLSSPNDAALSAAFLAAVGQAHGTGDHITYIDGGTYHFKVWDGSAWQTIAST